MKLGTIRRILKEEIAHGEDFPKWAGALLDVLNPFIEKVASALNGRITFDDNFLSVKKQIEFTSGVEKKVSSGSNFRVIGILPVYAGGKTLTGWRMRYDSSGQIGVTLAFSEGGSAPCTVYLLLG